MLSDMLQAPSLDLVRAVDLIQALQDILEEYRGESCFDSHTVQQSSVILQLRLLRKCYKEGGHPVETL